LYQEPDENHFLSWQNIFKLLNFGLQGEPSAGELTQRLQRATVVLACDDVKEFRKQLQVLCGAPATISKRKRGKASPDRDSDRTSDDDRRHDLRSAARGGTVPGSGSQIIACCPKCRTEFAVDYTNSLLREMARGSAADRGGVRPRRYDI